MTDRQLTTELIRGDQVFVLLASEWDALAQQGMTDTPFQTLAYQRAWWTHLGPGDLTTIVVRDAQDGALHGILCTYLFEGKLYFNGCVEETDYLDLISTPADARTVWEHALDRLLGEEAPDWQALEFCNLPADSPTLQLLPELLAARNITSEIAQHEVCPVIALPPDFDAYLDSLDRKQRHEVRRKLRRADGAEARYEIVGPDDDLRAAVDDFLSLLERSTLEKRDWLNDPRRAVFHEVAQAAQAAGTLQLMFVGVEGQRAAGLFNFVYRDRVWVYNSGLDPETFGWLSPGVVLTAKSIETAIAAGHKAFDFLRGNEEYKYRFGAVDTVIFRLSAQRTQT